jgi:hypothetical protein
MILAVLAVSAAALPARARPTKVAMTQIDGDTIGLWMAMEDALDDKNLEVVPTRHVTHVIDRLGLDEDLADRDIQKLAAELGADAIVQGVFEPHTRKVRFTIFAHGTRGRPFTVAARYAGTDQFRKQVHATMLVKLAAALQAGDAATDRGDTARDDATSRKAKKAAKTTKATAADDVVEIVDADDDSPARPAKPEKQKAPKAVAEASGEDGKKARRKAKTTKDTNEQIAAAASPKKDKQASRQKDSGAAVAAGDGSAKPPTPAKKVDGAAAVPGDSPQSAQEPDEPAAAAIAQAKADEAGEPPDAGTPPAAAKQVAERDDEIAPRATARFEPSPPAHSANRVAVRVDVGASLSTRDLRFQSTAFANAPKAYTNAPVPGGRVEAELYPFALGDPNSWLAGFGVAGDFDQTVALTLRASAEMTVPLKITERHYAYGLRYRLVFGHTPTSPTVTLGAGYGRRTFAVDRTGLMTSDSLDLPDVDYKLFDPGLAFRLPLGGRLAVTLDGRALLVTAAGQIQRADQYGRANILGGTGSAGLEIMFGKRVAFRVAAEATQLTFKFAGTGTLATSRDGDPTTIDVRAATDRYLGGAGTLAVFY